MPASSLPPRLSLATLDQATVTVERPRYDRAKLTTGIVHLGIGGFARCHLAHYTDDVLAQRESRGQSLEWGIVGVSLRRPEQRDLLAPQDGLYTCIERSPKGPRARIIGALQSVLVAPENPSAVLAAMASAATRVVTLTITEKGYCQNLATGQLDFSHPDIAADLAKPQHPVSALGFIVEALAQRRAAQLRPFTVVSCDNLMSNGPVLRRLVLSLAERRDPTLARWIADEARFPATMVDRIVPAASDADRSDAATLTGLTDAAAIAHEPFTQWVIEDDFVDGERPAWEIGGAEIVADVVPFERMKLRLLNAAHSALAYLGYLDGCETIGETLAKPEFSYFCRRLWHGEVIPILDGVSRPIMERYTEALSQRFANSAIRHRTWQIAMDGSLKLPVRVVPTLQARRKAGLQSPCLILTIAAWMRYVAGIDERGAPIDVRDPLAARLKGIADTARGNVDTQVKGFLAIESIFPPDLARDPQVVIQLVEALTLLHTKGARTAAISVS